MCQVISFLNCFAKYNISKDGFILVQWENENSVSVVNEKKVVEMKEGTTVDILIGTNKVRVAIW